jgi:hypothetical protein
VAKVEAGDAKGMIADLVPGSLPGIIEGLTVPGGAVRSADIRDIRVEGDEAVGETAYTSATGTVGLRSIWRQDDGGWKCFRLENFAVD